MNILMKDFKFKLITNKHLEDIRGGSLGQFIHGFLDGLTGNHHKH